MSVFRAIGNGIRRAASFASNHKVAFIIGTLVIGILITMLIKTMHTVLLIANILAWSYGVLSFIGTFSSQFRAKRVTLRANLTNITRWQSFKLTMHAIGHGLKEAFKNPITLFYLTGAILGLLFLAAHTFNPIAWTVSTGLLAGLAIWQGVRIHLQTKGRSRGNAFAFLTTTFIIGLSLRLIFTALELFFPAFRVAATVAHIASFVASLSTVGILITDLTRFGSTEENTLKSGAFYTLSMVGSAIRGLRSDDHEAAPEEVVPQSGAST